jgi:hypothetical protein
MIREVKRRSRRKKRQNNGRSRRCARTGNDSK